MKKLVIILVSLLVLVIVGVAIFLATFDADRYRPLLVTQLESALGKPVQLKRLSLGWRGGIAVELEGLTVYADTPMQGEPAAAIERVSAVVRLLPLLRKEIRIASVVIDKPVVRARRDASGAIEIVGLAVLAAPAAASGRAAGQAHGQPVNFDITMVRISDGVIGWTDELMHPPLVIRLNDVDVVLKNLSPVEPIDVDIRVAAFSETQNLTLKGRLRLPTRDHPGELENVRAETDLGRLE